jgi:preprotein translocase subunit SecY
MLSAFVNAFRVPDLRNKILFTLLIIGFYRLGSHVPVPGVDFTKIQELAGQTGGIVGLLNLFSGGALAQMAVFGLGIMPYITASIIMQLLTVVIPKLEAWQKEGEAGTKKITQWTRYMTIALALLQSTGLVFLAHRGFPTGTGENIQLITNFTPARVALIVLTFTAGTAMVMWLGELITQRGIGNGMSLIIFAAIVAELPGQGAIVYQQLGTAWFAVLAGLGVLIIVAIVIVEQGQRRIPVQYAKRVVGRKMYGGASTYIPLKVNQAGVIPIIFASSVLYFPQLISTVIPWEPLQRFVENHLVNAASPIYILAYGLMIVFFAFFYTAITFNPIDVADNMKKFGGFIPGLRPGRSTAEHLDFILTRITLPGSLFLAAVAVLPSVALALLQIQAMPFGGISILITVGVALETMKQVESQLTAHHYEGFLQ